MKEFFLIIFFITMIVGFAFNIGQLGCTSALIFIVLIVLREKRNIKEINLYQGSISFDSLDAAKLYIKSPDWIKFDLNIKKIRQTQTDTYKEIKLQRSLQLTSPFNYYRKKTVNTLKEYKKYINKGYYPADTINIVLASNYEILTLLLDLFEKAKEIKYLGKHLKSIIPTLPAKEIQFLEPMEEIDKHKDETIHEYLKNKKISVKSKAKKYSIEIIFDDNYKEFISFTELLRGNFYNKGYEEIFVAKYYHSAGTFRIYEPLILRNVEGTYSVVPIKDMRPLKLKLINFITSSKYMRFLYILISFFVRDNVQRDDSL